MSNPPTPDLEAHEPTEGKALLHATGIIGTMLIFLVIIGVTYLYRPNRPEPVDMALVEQRVTALREHKATQQNATSAYTVGADGTIRIPVDRAMRVVLDELRTVPVETSEVPAQ
jgi:hypothetical protein